jgi:hypothetical protein
MNELFHRPMVPDHQRNVGRPDLATIRYVYRPAGVLAWDGVERHIPERWQAIWRDDPGDVFRTWYPPAGATL